MYEIPKAVKFIHTQSRRVVAKGWDERKWGISVNDMKSQFRWKFRRKSSETGGRLYAQCEILNASVYFRVYTESGT